MIDASGPLPKFENVWQTKFAGFTDVVTAWEAITNERWNPQWDGNFAWLARDESNVIAFSFIRREFVKQLKHHFYCVDCNVLPAWRNKGIGRQMLQRTLDFVDTLHVRNPQDDCLGAFCLVKDPGLQSNKNEAIWPHTKLIFLGNTMKGQHLRVRYFNRSFLKEIVEDHK